MSLALLSGCGSFDKFLEGSQPSDARLRVALESSELTIIAGREASLTVTVTRVGDYAGPVDITVDGTPNGVISEVGTGVTTGAVTTSTVILRVGAATTPGRYVIAVRSHAAAIPVDSYAPLSLVVAEVPAYGLALAHASFTIARGGVAPAAVQLSRTNFAGPVTLALQGGPELQASFSVNPITGSSATMLLAVPSDAAPGVYHASLRGSAPGTTDQTVPLTVTVTNDALQLTLDPDIDARQGSVVPVGLFFNRNGYSGAVTLSAENLPAGVSAVFDPATPTGSTGTMVLTLQPGVEPATYAIRLRASGSGVPDATADALLGVKASGISLQIAPQSVSLYEGTGVPGTLTLTRTALDADVSVAVENAPAGVTVTPFPTTVGPGTPVLFFTVRAAAGTTPGDYVLTLRATPAGWPPGASKTISFIVTVRPLPSGTGNVVLDWSACAPPNWVAYQDGTGPWVQVFPAAGGVRFTVNAAKGAVAYVEGGNTVTVRYLTQSELIAHPLDMCPPPANAGTKSASGTGVHNSATEAFSYALGGATATSTGAKPGFTLQGIRDGLNDLVAFGSTQTIFGIRGLLRRDVELENGGSLGLVDLLGAESFAPVRPTLTVNGALAPDAVSHSMSYLTGAACTVNPLYNGTLGSTAIMSGVPAALQRASDFHQLTVTAFTGSRVRVATISFHEVTARTVQLGALVFPTVTPLSGPYQRLRAFLGNFSAVYNGSVTLRYVSGLRTMTVSASIGSVGIVGVELVMPDLSGVTGWPNDAAIPAGATGPWNVILDGGALDKSACTEGRTTFFMNQAGAF